LVAVKVPSCPTMLVGCSRIGDHGEKGDVVVFIDRLLGIDDGSIVMVGVGGVDGGNEVEGHSAMVHAVWLLTKVGMLKGMIISDVDSSSWFELVIFEGSEDFWIAVDECPKAGRGHDGDDLLN